MRCQVAFRRELRKLPDAPGVYFFLRRRLTRIGAQINADGRRVSQGDILYIGRATSLRNRVRSYFAPDIAENPSTSLRARRGPWIEKMVRETRSVDFKRTDSVLEALLLETELIKKFKPPYNTDQKDDKSFNCIVITREAYPAVLIARSRNVEFSSLIVNSQRLRVRRQKLLAAYGPFPVGFHLQTAMKIIRKIFPFRDSCAPAPVYSDVLKNIRTNTPCFNRQIGLCPGVCTGEISAPEYRRGIKRLALFLSGKSASVARALERAMKAAARAQEFERAGELKRQLFALRHIQDIALLRRSAADSRGFADADARRYESPSANISVPISEHPRFRVEAYDISHFGGKGIVGAMAVVQNGKVVPSEYRLFKIRGSAKQNDIAGLQEIIRRRLAHREWRFPHLIVVDGNKIQKRAAEDAIRFTGFSIPVVAVVKDEHHKPREILGFHEHSNIPTNVGMLGRETERAILLGNSEAHRFVLRFQRRGRS